MKTMKLLYRMYIVLKPQYGWNIAAVFFHMARFYAEYRRFRSLDTNPAFSISFFDWYPCLTDRTETTPLDPVYFYQDAWAARKIFENKPHHHYDVGSSAKTIGIISQFVPTTMVDIRPVELQLDNLFFRKGSILALPFDDNTVESISSLCVVEHIGLGRYGDPIDQFGSDKAIREIVRVTKPGGFIYFSVPVEETSKVYFNAHRSFTVDYISTMFKECTLIDRMFITDNILQRDFVQGKGYVVGLFMFKKK